MQLLETGEDPNAIAIARSLAVTAILSATSLYVAHVHAVSAISLCSTVTLKVDAVSML
jgi:hypothetical protein